MNKILHIALREFLATAATKGFIIGIGLTPLIILVAVFGMRTLLDDDAPRVEGEVAIIDPTGEVFDGVHGYLQPEAIAKRQGDLKDIAEWDFPTGAQQIGGVPGADSVSNASLDAIFGEVPQLDIVRLDLDTDESTAKEPLRVGDAQDGGRLALVVIHADAVIKQAGETRFGRYDLFVKEKLDDRIEDVITDGINDSIVDARVRLAGLDLTEIEALTRVGSVTSRTVTEKGEKDTNKALNFLMPMAFMLLLFIGVMTGGQYLMTTTIEDKSSRVVEVLLSAVSPMQLMTGKILGQMAVGFVILIAYAGMAIGTLVGFGLMGLLDLSLIVYLFIFYFIAFFIMASLMAAIGAAVNEIREAQTLMTPVMLFMMIPWILWLPITRDPNSMFALIASFIPPINTFVMMLRMTSTSPPPMWQVWLSIFVGLLAVYAAIWFASKVFRIGILMFGKPPDFKTLIRWVRMA